MKINYEKLYYFTENFSLSGRGFRVDPSESFRVDEVDTLVQGQWHPKRAIEFVHQGGKRLCDVIWTGFPPMVLISKAFRDVLKRESFTAWSTYPVKVYDKDGKQLRGYAGLAFLGRAGAVDFSRSTKVWRGPRYDGGPKWQNYFGLAFKDDKWDGSDFFMSEDRSSTYVTDGVKRALQELKIPNVEFERLSEYEEQVPDSLTKLRLVK